MLSLNNFDTNQFLEHYWQQKPLLIRNAFPNYKNPLSPEDLAGLACEQDIESRIIVEQNGNWQLKSGPFDEGTFLNLPNKHWTLLVQALDHWVPEVANLINYFRFLPNWRIDDVMASYATAGGSVGPHIDAYDVFLIQGLGQRRWQIGGQYPQDCQLQNNTQLRLLANFKPIEQWTVETGDILYIPPGYGHWGVGISDHCMTYSVGFRAPSYADIWSNFCDYQLDSIDPHLRYTDSQLTQQEHAGEISEFTIQKVQKILSEQVTNTYAIKKWFGSYITQAKYSPSNDQLIQKKSFEEIKNQIIEQGLVLRNPSVRFAFTQLQGNAILFVDGKEFQCSHTIMPLVQLLSSIDNYNSADILKLVSCSESRHLLLKLFNYGYLYCEDELLD